MNKEKLKKSLPFIILSVFSLMIIAYLLIQTSVMKIELHKMNETVMKQEKTIKKYENILKLDDSGINQNTSLKEDMETYIRKRYTKIPKVVAKEVAKEIVFYSQKYNLLPELVLGIVETESMFNPLAESAKGAKGLMQVMPEWVPKLNIKNVNDLHDIDTGIDAGIQVFLIHLEEAKGSISGGLYRYVNKDHNYVKQVYSAVGRFVTYRTTIDAEEELNDSIN